jgi:hypothetical protein
MESSLRASFTRIVSRASRKNDSINHLEWRKWVNSLRSHLSNDYVIPLKDLSDYAEYLSRWPSMFRQQEIFALIGESVLARQKGSGDDDAQRIMRSFLEAGLHIVPEDTKRFKRRQVTDTRRVTSGIVRMALPYDESLFCAALARRQGWFDRPPVTHESAPDPTSPFHVRAEYLWARAVMGSPIPSLARWINPVQDFAPYRIGSAKPGDIRSLLQVSEASRAMSCESGIARDCSDLIASLTSDHNMATESIWWLAVSKSPFPELTLPCARTCANRSDLLSENQKWVAVNGLRSLIQTGSISPPMKADLEQLVNIIRLPKRSDLAWKSPITILNSFKSN